MLLAVSTNEGAGAHAFVFNSLNGQKLPLSDFKGHVVLIVNTASRCGFTRQYKGLVSLWRAYRDREFVVLGIPSNDFGGQESGTTTEIKEFCEFNFEVDFPMTEKNHVIGNQAHPFFKWAASELGVIAKPRWNFHKYLIGPDGRLVDWFSSLTSPSSKRVIKAIEAQIMLKEKLIYSQK